ncbi:chitobiase/beta-hexosaminidase C-terminal domain-containing protein [Paenibacillus thalictri]|uniref:SLH domain-containing protein n=1 Tax=Paenibacillus thalictri TaxID=2527873 RepID=A0A4Q9DHZ9_9BACL|nr:chitobiase/beta-hexosaminidase C-terminal domain-containing protein [Paenibacillus thalictri]TBL70078.1 hypothetical protein EYB31_34270 [Paenibacillus thalictri]
MSLLGASQKARRTLAVVMSICLIFSSLGVAFAAEEVKDIKGHWAETSLQTGIAKGYIQGYPDSTFKPDNAITRAEFVTVVNRAFGFTEKAEVQAKDVDSKNWAYDQIAIALKAGYISGYSDGTIKPGNVVSRQEVAVMLAKVLKLDTGKDADLSKFKDTAKLPDWSKAAFGAVVSKGVFNGYEDGTLGFEKSLTRAEAVVTLERALGGGTAAFYNQAGTYGPATGNDKIEGNVVIGAAGVTLRNTTISGNLTIGENVGDGDVTLDNVTVNGDTVVNGGGASSVHFKDSILVTIVVNKKTGEVRIVAEGKTTVKQVNVQSSSKIDNSNATNGGFSNVSLQDKLPAGSKVSLLGSFENVDISAKSIAVDVPNGTIKNLNVGGQGGDTSLNLGKDAKVLQLVLNAILKVLGDGKIDKATINKGAEGTTFQTQPNSVQNNSGATFGPGSGSNYVSSSSDVIYATLDSVSVPENGKIVLNMTYGLISFTPTVKVSNNGGTATDVAISSSAIDVSARTLTLTVPTILLTASSQNVTYTVTYSGVSKTGSITLNALSQVAAPTANPAPGPVPAGTTVALSSTTVGAAVYYTVDGTTPTASSMLYSSAIAIQGTGSFTIKAFAAYQGLTDSEVATFTYPIIPAPGFAAAPTASPAAGAVASGTQVTLSSVNAAVYYTTDNSDPTTSSTLFTTPITITGPVTIKAIAAQEGLISSQVVSFPYTITSLPTVTAGVYSVFTSFDAAVTSNVYALSVSSSVYQIGANDTNPYLVIKFDDNLDSDYSGVALNTDLPGAQANAVTTSVYQGVYVAVIPHSTLAVGETYNITLGGLKRTVSSVTYQVDTISFSVYRQ